MCSVSQHKHSPRKRRRGHTGPGEHDTVVCVGCTVLESLERWVLFLVNDVVGIDNEVGALGDGGVGVCGERVCEPFGVYGVVCVVARQWWCVGVIVRGRDVQLPDSLTTSSFCAVSGGVAESTHWSVAEEEGYSECACHRVRGGSDPGNLIFIRPVLSRVFTSASSPGNLCIM